MRKTSFYLQLGGRRKEKKPESPFDQFLDSVGMTYAELARRLGVSRESVRLWASGKSAPYPERIVEIARILEVPPDVVRAWFPPEEPEHHSA